MVSENERMVKIELEAAEALAGLAHFSTNHVPESHGSDSIVERVKDESNSSFDTFHKSCSTNSNYEDATDCMPKNSDKPSILTAKTVKDERNTELTLNPTYPTNCASSVRKCRQNLTEEEMEARKIRRVLANRESARQTIRRRQAVFEELTRKAVDLAWENENLKREKDKTSQRYNSLKTKNERLKEQMIKVMKIETDETREDQSITINEPTISASSTNSPFIIYNQPPFLPFVWPTSVQLQCGPPAGIVFPSQIANKPDTSSCEEGSSMSSLYLLPCPWVVTLPQNSNNNENRPHSFNLNDKPKEYTECQEFFPDHKVKSETPNYNGDGVAHDSNPKVATTTTALVSSNTLIDHEHDEPNTSLLMHHLKAGTTGDGEQVIGDDQIMKIHQDPVVCSGKRLCDTAAATEARKRRKELTRLKSHFHSRQLRMH